MNRQTGGGSRPQLGAIPAKVLACAIAAFAGSAVWAGAASADTITFDHGFLKISGFAEPLNVVEDGSPVGLNNVTYSGGTSGDFSVTTADFNFPTFEGTVDAGVPLEFTMTPLETLTGNLSPATLTSSVTDFRADIAFGDPINSSCRISPIPLALGTTNSRAFVGNAFDAGTFDGPTNGAVTDGWANLPPPVLNSGSSCALIEGVTAGCGGLWLSNGIDTPALA